MSADDGSLDGSGVGSRGFPTLKTSGYRSCESGRDISQGEALRKLFLKSLAILQTDPKRRPVRLTPPIPFRPLIASFSFGVCLLVNDPYLHTPK